MTMKKFLLAAVALISIGIVSSEAIQTRLDNYPPGFRTIDGSQLNKMVAAVNALTGNGVTNLISASNITGATAGASGEVQINSSSALVCASYYFTGTPAATDQVFFIATRAYRIKTISEVHAVAAGGASKLQVTKDTSTDAPGAGTDILTNNTNAGFDLAATANTVQVGGLSATAATLVLAAGDRLSVDFADAIQSSAGVVVTACLAPL